jgi:hypothetical protein
MCDVPGPCHASGCGGPSLTAPRCRLPPPLHPGATPEAPCVRCGPLAVPQLAGAEEILSTESSEELRDMAREERSALSQQAGGRRCASGSSRAAVPPCRRLRSSLDVQGIWGQSHRAHCSCRDGGALGALLTAALCRCELLLPPKWVEVGARYLLTTLLAD